MSSDLNVENRRLRRQLDSLLQQARRNEEKMGRFNAQELRLIGTTSLVELVQLILHENRRVFELDTITLALLDPEYETVRMLEAAGVQLEGVPELIFETEPSQLNYIFNGNLTPKLGGYYEAHHDHFFPAKDRRPKSVALLPLVRRGELIGSLNLGSLDAQRYARGKGTEFLQRLAAVVAIALENTLNHERLKLVGLTDPLTRVNNRRFFDQRLGEEIAVSQRSHQWLACMFLDVDHFKRINDSLGHQGGDIVLCEIARLVRGQLRSTDVLCRYGGEEFVVLLPNTGNHEALEIAERIRAVIETTEFSLPGPQRAKVTISIGVAARQCQKTCDANTVGKVLVASADQAVYQAKEAGRNQVVLAAA